MEKLDKNYIIGFILLFVMYGTYMYFMPAPVPPEPEKVEQKASPANTQAELAPVIVDSAQLVQKFGEFAAATSGEAKEVVLENDQLKVTLSSKGGNLSSVVLTKYKTYETYANGGEEPMKVLDAINSKQKLEIATGTGTVDLRDLYFTVTENTSNKAVFALQLPNGKTVTQTYILPSEGFILDYKVEGTALSGSQNVSLTWENKLQQLEKDMLENRKAAQINYYDIEEDFNDIGLNSTSDEIEDVEEKVKWFSFKQKYFTSGVFVKDSYFDGLKATLLVPTEDTTVVKDATVSTAISSTALASGLQYYFGPNDLEELKKVGEGFHKNLYLGYDIIKPINRFIFVPLFDWVESFISNYGLLIIIVVLMIKLTLTPLIYKSYTSSAKMRVLAPEIAEIKEKVGDDAAKVQQETMKLYQQVGVSPLSGCVPMLLQMPILMSVFFLFPNMEMFRQKSFLWANDLSTYDAPISWGFDIPVIGNHLSLFVVLMTISSLAFTYYNNQITPTQPGPVDMKKISYIFPLVFFFVLNSFPAALSFYYLVSNLVTIAQQLIVKRFVDEDKIKTILEENKRNYATKPKKANKFSNYLQKQLDAQEASNKEKAASLKNKKKK